MTTARLTDDEKGQLKHARCRSSELTPRSLLTTSYQKIAYQVMLKQADSNARRRFDFPSALLLPSLWDHPIKSSGMVYGRESRDNAMRSTTRQESLAHTK